MVAGVFHITLPVRSGRLHGFRLYSSTNATRQARKAASNEFSPGAPRLSFKLQNIDVLSLDGHWVSSCVFLCSSDRSFRGEIPVNAAMRF